MFRLLQYLKLKIEEKLKTQKNKKDGLKNQKN